MPETMPVKKYNCSQAEFYATVKLAWGSCDANLADFTNFATTYNAALIAARKTQLSDAKAMPDVQARGEAGETFGIQLSETAKTANLKWLSLRRYIEKAYKGPLAKPKLEAAGHDYYETANQQDWEDMDLMLEAGKNFITTFGAPLTADAGMPAAFPADYNLVYVAFNGLYDQFKNAPQSAQEGTRAKMLANNDLYDKTIEMMKDGQTIYYNNAAKRERFIWEKVLSLVTPPIGGGLPVSSLVIKGKITNNNNGDGIVNAVVTINEAGNPEPGVSVTTNENGDYNFRADGLQPNAPIVIHHKVEAPGFVTQEKDINMTVGQTFTVDVVMNPV
jgi:hypothetical protein